MFERFASRLRVRLSSSGGETLVETLLAILISSLAMVMLANAISATVGITDRSREASKQHYKAENSLMSGGEHREVEVRLKAEDGSVRSQTVGVLAQEKKVVGGYEVVLYEAETSNTGGENP